MSGAILDTTGGCIGGEGPYEEEPVWQDTIVGRE